METQLVDLVQPLLLRVFGAGTSKWKILSLPALPCCPSAFQIKARQVVTFLQLTSLGNSEILCFSEERLSCRQNSASMGFLEHKLQPRWTPAEAKSRFWLQSWALGRAGAEGTPNSALRGSFGPSRMPWTGSEART